MVAECFIHSPTFPTRLPKFNAPSPNGFSGQGIVVLIGKVEFPTIGEVMFSSGFTPQGNVEFPPKGKVEFPPKGNVEFISSIEEVMLSINAGSIPNISSIIYLPKSNGMHPILASALTNSLSKILQCFQRFWNSFVIKMSYIPTVAFRQ